MHLLVTDGSHRFVTRRDPLGPPVRQTYIGVRQLLPVTCSNPMAVQYLFAVALYYVNNYPDCPVICR